jgi:Protease inhibitor Inh
LIRLIPNRLAAAAVLSVVLAGCQGSGRFSDFDPAPRPVAQPVRPAPLTPAPMSPVQSAPLPPVSSQPLPPPGSGLPPIGSSVPIETPDGGQPRVAARPVQPIDPQPQAEPPPRPPQVAARPEPAAPQASGPPTRTAVTGNWTAREAAGGSCRVTLSSAPTLDLYKANSSGCQSRELQRVNAWELRGDEVYLYEPGGGVAARLKQAGRNFEGSVSRTGAPVTLSK